MIRYALALALLAAPATAFAQANPGPVTVEIVANGQVTVPAQRFRFSVKLTAKGKDEAAASAVLAANRAKLVQSLAALNIREARPLAGPPRSLAGLISSFGTRSKPNVTLDMVSEISSDTTGEEESAAPGYIATEEVTFDATSRAAISGAEAAVKASGGATEKTVLALLDDYVGPMRKAKADAIAKAQDEANAYAVTLGLRRATVVKISERQDFVAATTSIFMEFMSFMTNVAAPGPASDETVVPVSLVVEFQLTR
ncbi:SIMPL domain-containing protein [Sphingomonas canadensis]|uniref:SIMPL domain-containing protein n=1 Tax=Sphingomonas canadensis TaxID=1219257 RepID=A0ABW3HBK5_9SPHN|nr:SIMPL domain-containing protein [Sphingomonas canadensis]MCW3837522.1 SIMPL domain-containing protein [Sphingomonas canadensis]